ncbi:hypothetical protein AB0C96_16975 [Streptomyces sp. NPDC048506]|uniref:hypothetical protein n=1 Tax=Streptomyces sp. NPDC048506 TaxID=3155028 RepID=UPI00341D9D47
MGEVEQVEQPAEDLGDELRRLHRAAGSPAVGRLVELAHGRLPAGQRPTAAAVHGWLHDGTAPASCTVLLAFVELLDGLARQTGGEGHLPRSPQWWELLWYRTTHPPSDAPGESVGNVVDGHARLLGPTVQAGAINGGVHVHPPPDPANAPSAPPSGVPQQRDPRVVIRVQRGTETIEFYDEGLARIWITAVLDQRQSEDGGRGDEH